MTSRITVLFVATISIAWLIFRPVSSSGPVPEKEATLDEQTEDGVTVRLQKVTVDRIFDVDAFLDRHYDPANESNVAVRELAAQSAVDGSLRLVRLFFSYSGTVAGHDVTVSFPDFEPAVSGEFHVASQWKQHFVHLQVEDQASGTEQYFVVPSDVAFDRLFPCNAQMTIEKAGGGKLSFQFSAVSP